MQRNFILHVIKFEHSIAVFFNLNDKPQPSAAQYFQTLIIIIATSQITTISKNAFNTLLVYIRKLISTVFPTFRREL